MNIDEFYDADPRRRASDEVEYGRDWHDEEQVRFEISWVADTGEVYAMRQPMEPIDVIPAFGTGIVEPLDIDTVTVEVLGVVETREELDRRLAGWETAMTEEGSMAWIRERFVS